MQFKILSIFLFALTGDILHPSFQKVKDRKRSNEPDDRKRE